MLSPGFDISYCKASDSLIRETEDFIRLWEEGSDSILCHTSGSTGEPKPIRLKKKHMIHSARLTGEIFRMGEGSRALMCLSLSYIAAKMMLVRAMVLGWKLTVTEPTSTPLESVDEKFDFVALVPMQLYRSAEKLESVREILVGGGRVNRDFIQRIPSGMKTRIRQSYSMTETATHVALRELYPTFEESYRTIPGVEVGSAKDGTLIINAPALGAERLQTRDLATVLSPCEFLLLGRSDQVINSGGIKIFPQQTEEKLSSILHGRYFVAGMPDPTLGECQVLFIEGNSSEQERIKSFIDKNFDRYHRPRRIYFMETFPLTHTGKIDQKKILAHFTGSSL